MIDLSYKTYWCLAGNGWEWGNGIIITSDYGSFPHSLLSTSKKIIDNGLLPALQRAFVTGILSGAKAIDLRNFRAMDVSRRYL